MKTDHLIKRPFYGWVLILFGSLLLAPVISQGVEDSEISGERKEIFQKIKGGRNFEDAAAMEFNRDYKLNHHQKKGEYDYFSIVLPPESEMTLELRTFEKGISWNQGRRVTTTEPFAGLQLRDEVKNVDQVLEITGQPNMTRKVTLKNSSGQAKNYYLLVGTPHGSLHKDQVAFKATILPVRFGDLGTEGDAGSTPETAFPIGLAELHSINSIGGEDPKDVYSFTAKKKQWYAVAVRSEDPIQPQFRVRILTPKRKELLSYESGGTEQVITKSFKARHNGEYFVEISLLGGMEEKSLYSMEVSKLPGPIVKR